MNDKLGLVAYETEAHPFLPSAPGVPVERTYSQQTAREIDCAVRDLVREAFETATGILSAARPVLERGAAMVLEKESIGEIELRELGQALQSILTVRQGNPSPAASVSSSRLIA